MKTKFVYVLTCTPEALYVEWALISLCSLRRIHPSAYTVLIVDDVTDNVLVGDRAEILEYVSEKYVAYDCPQEMSLNERSRFLKTSVRQRIEGDYLFVDCDTVICKSLKHLDGMRCVGACLDSHLYLSEYSPPLYEELRKKIALIGLNIEEETTYFNSGIMYVPDNEESHHLYNLWHKIWLDNLPRGIYQDQPALAKANRDCGYPIQRLSDFYNCIVYTQNNFIRDAYILHISSFKNPSYLFTNKVLDFIKKNGVKHKWIQWVISHPIGTMLPFDYTIYHSTIKQRYYWILEMVQHLRLYGQYIDNSYTDFPMNSHLKLIVRQCFKHKMYYSGSVLWMIWKRIQVLKKRNILKDNINKR